MHAAGTELGGTPLLSFVPVGTSLWTIAPARALGKGSVDEVQHHDPVVVDVDARAGPERHPAEGDGRIDLAEAVVAARARIRSQRADPEVELCERRDVANGPVEDEASPAALEREPGHHVADERDADRAAAVDDEDAAVPRLRHLPLHEHVVLVAADGAD